MDVAIWAAALAPAAIVVAAGLEVLLVHVLPLATLFLAVAVGIGRVAAGPF